MSSQAKATTHPAFPCPTSLFGWPVSSVPRWLQDTELTKPLPLDNSRMRNVLKMTPPPPEKSLVDMAYSMIEGGHIPKTGSYSETK